MHTPPISSIFGLRWSGLVPDEALPRLTSHLRLIQHDVRLFQTIWPKLVMVLQRWVGSPSGLSCAAFRDYLPGELLVFSLSSVHRNTVTL